MQASTSSFPQHFAWGVATSAYQIEGAHDVDGRGPSIWDTFCRQPGAIDNGDNGDVACDHYHRWPADLDLMTQLGVNAYRLSIGWPRIQPDGTGAVNPKGIAFYDALIDGLLTRGITPFVTLYHWDLPQTLQDKGGWPRRDTAYAFGDYAAIVAAALGDRVVNWTTLNEPLCSAWLGHLEGVMAPGLTSIEAAVPASVHLHLAHGLGVQAIRSTAALTPSVGIVNNLGPAEPASDRPEDIAAAVRQDGHTNRWWLDPIHGRGYPQDMVDTYGVEPPLRGNDLELIAQPLDYLGVNYYKREVVRDDPTGSGPRAAQLRVPGALETAMDWEVHPQGLEDILVRVNDEYRPRQIQVTENGSAWIDHVDADSRVDDLDRAAYLESHIEACAGARRRGAPIAGYFAWSLLDNFEWAYGYDKRFGLVRVDFASQRRTIKTSGRRFAEIIARHRAANNSGGDRNSDADGGSLVGSRTGSAPVDADRRG
ncbi:MAG: GH1 family beta-glucosidase [Actinomycetota bacterium]|nr:GH1 family beta-glucosidase [Actinomycetota bacterium]